LRRKKRAGCAGASGAAQAGAGAPAARALQGALARGAVAAVPAESNGTYTGRVLLGFGAASEPPADRR
jgi:hypothetical protein